MTTPSKDLTTHHESTYQMLVEAEEKERDLIEVAVYLLLILATITTIWQFGREPVRLADIGVEHAEKVASVYL